MAKNTYVGYSGKKHKSNLRRLKSKYGKTKSYIKLKSKFNKYRKTI